MKREPGLMTRWLGGMKLRTKLIAAFLVVALVPVTAVGVYAYRFMRRSMLERVEEGMASGIRQLQIAANDKLQRYEQVLQYLMYDNQTVAAFTDVNASYYDIYYNMQEVYLPLLFTIREMNSDIGQIGVYTDNPALRPRGSEVMALSDVREIEQAQSALKKHTIIWDIVGDELVAMGAMMRLTRQAPENIAYLRVCADALLDYEPGDVDVWAIALCDGDRLMTVQTHGGLDIPQNLWTGEESGTVSVDGAKLFIVQQTLERTGWSIRFICPYDQLHIDMSGLVWMVLLAVVGSLGVLAFISVLVSRSITHRIHSLNRAMAQVERGALTERPAVQPWERDEIAEITTYFGNMMDSLNNYIEINYKNQIDLRDAELRMLQAQINPHFLYNMLSMINWMALERGEVEISEVLMQLSQFYRMMLVKRDSSVSVRDEVENITGYLELQMRLHEDSFDVELDIDEAILDYRMIGMVLQPIVENAIAHGLDVLRDRRGKLSIIGRQERDDLVFTVADNGPGMTAEQFADHLNRPSEGYGLKNVNDRLRIAFGPRWGLTMPASAEEGTVIMVRIPVRDAQTNVISDRRSM